MFIDGDNFPPRSYAQIHRILKERGDRLSSKRVFADFIKHPTWRDPCLEFGIEAVMTWADGRKNATDFHMVVDIMASSAKFDTFVIVTGDGDFKSLLVHLQSQGKHVTVMTNSLESTTRNMKNFCDELIVVPPMTVLAQVDWLCQPGSKALPPSMMASSRRRRKQGNQQGIPRITGRK